jgi:hypothetical protein
MTIKLITRLHAVFVVMILTSGCSRQTERLKGVRGLTLWEEKRKKKETESETRGEVKGKKSTVHRGILISNSKSHAFFKPETSVREKLDREEKILNFVCQRNSP